MSYTIGIPMPDCAARRDATRGRRAVIDKVAERRGYRSTRSNGEETDFDLCYALNYHKGLPHDMHGAVHGPSYNAMVRMLTAQEYGAFETLPVGENRKGANGTDTDPQRYAEVTIGKETTKYRKMTSPFTGHVFDPQGADAGVFAMPPAPLVATDELASEMAELYAMALLRDVGFAQIADGSGPGVTDAVDALKTMPWFQKQALASLDEAEQRRFESRKPIASGADLFRGSTPGSRSGPLLSQFLLMGSDNKRFTFEQPNGVNPPENDPASQFVGRLSEIGREDGFVLFGTQIVDQRSIVAKEGVDYLTNWASWLDCQNGADFNDIDIFRHRRRFLTTPRDLCTYVHYDALYQAYLTACLLMLSEGFARDRGMPESGSRTRDAFAQFGGPHILSLVTEVATRGLKAVWRQKWLHHRRARPEIVAALLTLHAHDPLRIENERLRGEIDKLRAKLPGDLMAAVAARNAAQNADAPIDAKMPLPAGFPDIADGENFLLPMAFPEGSPTHPAYGAGHATVAGACVTVLKAFFEMYGADGKPLAWPYPQAFVAEKVGIDGTRLADIGGGAALTIEGELDKLAANISVGRNMAGVHYYTDYFESLRLGERIAVSILEDQLSCYGEPVSLSFTSFDGERVRIASNGEEATIRIVNGSGRIAAEEWFARYAA